MILKNSWLKPRTSGFTLIELLVVIAIIGILATFSVISLSNVRTKSRDIKRVADVKQLQTAMELFFNDSSRYPTEEEFAAGALSFTSSGQSIVYMAQIPTAPTPADGDCTSGDNTYSYFVSSDYSNYRIDFCISGKVGAVDGGLLAGTPIGFAKLDQGVFIDEAMANVKVVGLPAGQLVPNDSDIIYTTDTLGRFKFVSDDAAKVAFFADRDYKVKFGEINADQIADDRIITPSEINLALRAKVGDDYKKLREANTKDKEALNLARFITTISDKSQTFSLGRKINDDNITKIEKYLTKNKIESINEDNFGEVIAEMEKNKLFTFATDVEVVKVLEKTNKDIQRGVYTPTKDNIKKLQDSFSTLTPEEIKIKACNDSCSEKYYYDEKKIAECQKSCN